MASSPPPDSNSMPMTSDMIMGLVRELAGLRGVETPYVSDFFYMLQDHPVVRYSRERTMGPPGTPQSLVFYFSSVLHTHPSWLLESTPAPETVRDVARPSARSLRSRTQNLESPGITYNL